MYSADQIREALFFVEDVFRRLAMEWVLLRKTADDIRQRQLTEAKGVYLGLRKYELTESRLEHIEHFLEGIKREKGKLLYTHTNGVPVEIKIINRDYQFINRPDQVVYLNEAYNIPNQWDEYWKQRYLIR